MNRLRHELQEKFWRQRSTARLRKMMQSIIKGPDPIMSKSASEDSPAKDLSLLETILVAAVRKRQRQVGPVPEAVCKVLYSDQLVTGHVKNFRS